LGLCDARIQGLLLSPLERFITLLRCFPAISLLGIYPKECNSGYSVGNCTSMFIAVLFIVAKL
jgi:hypothetical protein